MNFLHVSLAPVVAFLKPFPIYMIGRLFAIRIRKMGECIEMYARTFILSQGEKSATVYLAKGALDDDIVGRWTMEDPGFSFPDTNEHNQFMWSPQMKFIAAMNNIGMTVTDGDRPVITLTNADIGSRAFDLYNIDYKHLRPGNKGRGLMWFAHSHALKADMFDWEFKGLTLLSEWNPYTD